METIIFTPDEAIQAFYRVLAHASTDIQSMNEEKE